MLHISLVLYADEFNENHNVQSKEIEAMINLIKKNPWYKIAFFNQNVLWIPSLGCLPLTYFGHSFSYVITQGHVTICYWKTAPVSCRVCHFYLGCLRSRQCAKVLYPISWTVYALSSVVWVVNSQFTYNTVLVSLDISFNCLCMHN